MSAQAEIVRGEGPSARFGAVTALDGVLHVRGRAVGHPFIGAMRDAPTASGRAPRCWGPGAHSDIGLPTDMANTPPSMFGPGDPPSVRLIAAGKGRDEP